MSTELTGILYDDGEPPPGYLVYCPQIDVLTQGDSVVHAQEMIQEAVEGVIELLPGQVLAQLLSQEPPSLEDYFADDDDVSVVEVGRFTFAVELPAIESSVG